jgi:hypothetical protein
MFPSQYKPHDELVMLSCAQVDRSWQKQPATAKPKLRPQAHMVNARTNPDWHHESEGKVIQGQLDWYTTILTEITQPCSFVSFTHYLIYLKRQIAKKIFP